MLTVRPAPLPLPAPPKDQGHGGGPSSAPPHLAPAWQCAPLPPPRRAAPPAGVAVLCSEFGSIHEKG